MLTYASVEDFVQMANLNKTGLVTDTTDGYEKIREYLERATDYISRISRRRFIPIARTNKYPIPYAFLDLSIRQMPSAELRLDDDLLEITGLNNGVQDIDINNEYYFLKEPNIYPKISVVLQYPYYWGGIYSGTYFERYDTPIINVTGMWGYYDRDYEYNAWVNTLETVPVGGMTASQTTLVLNDVDGKDANRKTRFTTNSLIRIDNELIEINDINTATNTLTIIRGARGSLAASHLEGVQIKKWVVLPTIQEVCLVIAKAWRESDISIGGRIGVSDVSAGVEVGIPADAQTILKSYLRTFVNLR